MKRCGERRLKSHSSGAPNIDSEGIAGMGGGAALGLAAGSTTALVMGFVLTRALKAAGSFRPVWASSYSCGAWALR